MKIYYTHKSWRHGSHSVVVVAANPLKAAIQAGEDFCELDMEEIGTANVDQEEQVILRDQWSA